MSERGPIRTETGPQHNCALVGITVDRPAKLHPNLIYGLTALNHRGQEAAGMVWSDGKNLMKRKNLGIVTQVFSDEVMEKQVSKYGPLLVGVGHSRYSTVDRNNIAAEKRNIQPFIFNTKGKKFAIAHNGTVHIDYPLDEDDPQSDTFRVGQAIADMESPFEESVIEVLSNLEGAYTFLFATPDDLYVARDPWGFRPCKVGRLSNGESGYVVASETVAIDKMGAEFEGNIKRGQFLKVTEKGLVEPLWTDPRKDGLVSAYCSFEHAYFADPPSLAREQVSNDDIRTALGKRLAERVKPDVDVVMGVPKSGLSYAEGVALEAGVSTSNGIQENRFQFRSFIKGQEKDERRREAGFKFNLIASKIRGRKIAVVDDSIVRGNTSSGLILNLFEAGAAEIHLMVGVPPIKAPCYWGVDFKHPDELVYHLLMSDPDRQGTFEERIASWLVRDDPELIKKLKVSFQALDDYISIIRDVPQGTHHLESGACFHCVTGDAPTGTKIPVTTLFKTSV